jgi:hypothetical protein
MPEPASSSKQREVAGDENDTSLERPSTAAKSSEDKELIRLALHRNPYFTCMDEEQIERFIQVAELQTFRPGPAVILEGCQDERDERRCPLFRGNPPPPNYPKTKGDSRGVRLGVPY